MSWGKGSRTFQMRSFYGENNTLERFCIAIGGSPQKGAGGRPHKKKQSTAPLREYLAWRLIPHRALSARENAFMSKVQVSGYQVTNQTHSGATVFEADHATNLYHHVALVVPNARASPILCRPM